jgi:hypothetical protein
MIKSMPRAKCVARETYEGQADNDVTVGKFYDVSGYENVMGNPEPFIRFVGDTGVEISRPKRQFVLFTR